MTNMQTLKGDKCKVRRVREGKGGSLSRKSLVSLPVLLLESLLFTRSNRIQFSFLSIQLPERNENNTPTTHKVIPSALRIKMNLSALLIGRFCLFVLIRLISLLISLLILRQVDLA